MKLSHLLNLFPSQIAYAHCDVPCGIYTSEPSKTAAKTILVMMQKMHALKKEDDTPDAKLSYKNALSRMTWTKEEHARILKHELTVLWADYFKPEHLSMFPDLHDIFWNALKLASKAKQTIDLKTAENLVNQVDKIATMFQKAENIKRSS